MSSVNFTEDALSKAAQSVRNAMLNSLPNPSDCEYEFSDEFQAKMESVSLRANYLYRKQRINLRIASVFAVILLTSSIWLTIDVEARGVVFNWIREAYENSIVYRFFGNDTKVGLPHYEPSYIPEGFEKVYDFSDETMHGQFYQKTNGKSGIVIEYYVVIGNIHTELITKNEGNIREVVNIKGIEADYYQAAGDSNTNNLIWIDEKQNLVFSVNSDLAKADIMRIAEGMTLIVPEK